MITFTHRGYVSEFKRATREARTLPTCELNQRIQCYTDTPGNVLEVLLSICTLRFNAASILPPRITAYIRESVYRELNDLGLTYINPT